MAGAEALCLLVFALFFAAGESADLEHPGTLPKTVKTSLDTLKDVIHEHVLTKGDHHQGRRIETFLNNGVHPPAKPEAETKPTPVESRKPDPGDQTKLKAPKDAAQTAQETTTESASDLATKPAAPEGTAASQTENLDASPPPKRRKRSDQEQVQSAPTPSPSSLNTSSNGSAIYELGQSIVQGVKNTYKKVETAVKNLMNSTNGTERGTAESANSTSGDSDQKEEVGATGSPTAGNVTQVKSVSKRSVRAKEQADVTRRAGARAEMQSAENRSPGAAHQSKVRQESAADERPKASESETEVKGVQNAKAKRSTLQDGEKSAPKSAIGSRNETGPAEYKGRKSAGESKRVAEADPREAAATNAERDEKSDTAAGTPSGKQQDADGTSTPLQVSVDEKVKKTSPAKAKRRKRAAHEKEDSKHDQHARDKEDEDQKHTLEQDKDSTHHEGQYHSSDSEKGQQNTSEGQGMKKGKEYHKLRKKETAEQVQVKHETRSRRHSISVRHIGLKRKRSTHDRARKHLKPDVRSDTERVVVTPEVLKSVGSEVFKVHHHSRGVSKPANYGSSELDNAGSKKVREKRGIRELKPHEVPRGRNAGSPKSKPGQHTPENIGGSVINIKHNPNVRTTLRTLKDGSQVVVKSEHPVHNSGQRPELKRKNERPKKEVEKTEVPTDNAENIETLDDAKGKNGQGHIIVSSGGTAKRYNVNTGEHTELVPPTVGRKGKGLTVRGTATFVKALKVIDSSALLRRRRWINPLYRIAFRSKRGTEKNVPNEKEKTMGTEEKTTLPEEALVKIDGKIQFSKTTPSTEHKDVTKSNTGPTSTKSRKSRSTSPSSAADKSSAADSVKAPPQLYPANKNISLDGRYAATAVNATSDVKTPQGNASNSRTDASSVSTTSPTEDAKSPMTVDTAPKNRRSVEEEANEWFDRMLIQESLESIATVEPPDGFSENATDGASPDNSDTTEVSGNTTTHYSTNTVNHRSFNASSEVSRKTSDSNVEETIMEVKVSGNNSSNAGETPNPTGRVKIFGTLEGEMVKVKGYIKGDLSGEASAYVVPSLLSKYGDFVQGQRQGEFFNDGGVAGGQSGEIGFYGNTANRALNGVQQQAQYADNQNSVLGQRRDNGYYGNQAGAKSGHDVARNFNTGQAFDKKGQSGAFEGTTGGHRKGYKNAGFRNTYHKDESANQSSFFDDLSNEGGHNAFDTRGSSYSDQGADNNKGDFLNAAFLHDAAGRQGGFDGGTSYKDLRGQQGNYANNHNFDDAAKFNYQRQGNNHGGGSTSGGRFFNGGSNVNQGGANGYSQGGYSGRVMDPAPAPPPFAQSPTGFGRYQSGVITSNGLYDPASAMRSPPGPYPYYPPPAAELGSFNGGGNTIGLTGGTFYGSGSGYSSGGGYGPASGAGYKSTSGSFVPEPVVMGQAPMSPMYEPPKLQKSQPMVPNVYHRFSKSSYSSSRDNSSPGLSGKGSATFDNYGGTGSGSAIRLRLVRPPVILRLS